MLYCNLCLIDKLGRHCFCRHLRNLYALFFCQCHCHRYSRLHGRSRIKRRDCQILLICAVTLCLGTRRCTLIRAVALCLGTRKCTPFRVVTFYLIARQGYCCFDADTAIFFMYLPDAHVLDAGRRCSFYINRAPDSRIDKLRTPVPAKHGMCLAHQLVSFHRTAGDIVNGFIFLIGILFYKTQHGMKNNTDFIAAQMQIFFY